MNWADRIEARWQAWWPELESREQRLVQVAALLVVLAFLWWVALAPALRTMARARAEHPQLDLQLQQMAALQARAKELQGQPRAARDDAQRALETSVRQNLGGNAQLQPAGSGDTMTINLRGAPADTLASWFSLARGNARAVPREVRLTRSGQAPSAAAGAPASPPADGSKVLWDGTLVMNLPAR